jgi:dTDP-4-amino-4,6-dideoxygalactose transaminase
LKAQYATIKEEIDAAVAEVFQSQYFVLGPKVQECEAAIAEYSTCRHGVGVSSGTDAILIALMAEGIGPGDEVITTPYTFFATVGCISRLGATPVFVDIDPISYNIDPDQIAEKITDKTRAVMPVHLFGQMADMDPIMELGERHGLCVIEDAAQAIGAEYKGRRAGSIGHYGCFSFFPSKNLGAAGDGGMVMTNDPERADRLRCLRAHGSKPKYFHKMIGGNFRLDALQAAVVMAKLPYLDQWTAGRQANAARYRRFFEEAGLAGEGNVDLPRELPDRLHIYNQFVIRVPRRDELRQYLKDHRIGNEVYYPVPMHLQECFAFLGYQRGAMPHSESAAAESLALPIYPEIHEDQQRHVAGSVDAFLRAAPR